MFHDRVALTFTITDVVTGMNGSLQVVKLMATIPKPKLSFNFMGVIGMVVSSASRTPNKEPK